MVRVGSSRTSSSMSSRLKDSAQAGLRVFSRTVLSRRTSGRPFRLITTRGSEDSTVVLACQNLRVSLIAKECARTTPTWSSLTGNSSNAVVSMRNGSYRDTSGSSASTGRNFSHHSNGMTT